MKIADVALFRPFHSSNGRRRKLGKLAGSGFRSEMFPFALPLFAELTKSPKLCS